MSAKERPLWFLTLTQSCNLSCSYCGSDENYDVEDVSPHPREITYPLEKLANLLSEDANPIICFYGGEPLVRSEKITQIMALLGKLPTYVLQTNGTLLNRVPTETLLQFDTILCSVDGDSEITDENRGKGTYNKAITNCLDARKRGFSGDLIARMTVGNGHRLYANVSHLLSLGLFDHVHWQLDVLWDSPMFARWDDFLSWRDKDYNPAIDLLVKDFVENVEKNGKVLGIVPILGLLWSYLTDEKISHIRCSAGHKAFNVTTGGLITACPIAPEFRTLADITNENFDPKSVHDAEKIDGRCAQCDVLTECGGRCLYTNKTSWWGDEGFAEVCVSVRHLLSAVKNILPRIQKAIESGKVKLEQFHYPLYNNTTEIIP